MARKKKYFRKKKKIKKLNFQKIKSQIFSFFPKEFEKYLDPGKSIKNSSELGTFLTY
jgi:hypothetical protein